MPIPVFSKLSAKKPVGFALLRGVTGIDTLILHCDKKMSSSSVKYAIIYYEIPKATKNYK